MGERTWDRNLKGPEKAEVTADFNGVKLTLLKGDITEQVVDAIVNAANAGLYGGGGVDGAIHDVGGPSIMIECESIRDEKGGCPKGHAVITTAGRLKARYVIHTVGPKWRGGNEDEARFLTDAYRNSLELAAEKGVKSIAFPSVSTGVYHFPLEEAAAIALTTVKQFCQIKSSLEDIRFVLFTDRTYEAFIKCLNESVGISS